MTTLDTALLVHAHGMNVVVIPANTKRPLGKGWPSLRYSEDEIRKQFADPRTNVGLLLGPDSAIDIECDGPESSVDLRELFEGAIPETPSWSSTRGEHRLFAWDDRFAGYGAVIKYKTVEIRLGADGKGAQSLLPPSTTDGHTRVWIISPGNTPIAKLPDAVIDKILAAQVKPKPASVPQTRPQSPFNWSCHAKPAGQNTPGDDFCVRGTWEEILEPHGWEKVKANESEGKVHWRRPGKPEGGSSATTGHCTSEAGRDLFYVFSTDAKPFQNAKGYSKFAAYALLNHNEDFVAAAAELAERGFGTAAQQPASTSGKLIQIAEGFELFHTPARDPYATVNVGDHFETYGVMSTAFKEYLEYRHYLATGKAATQKSLSEAIGVIAAKARFEGKQIPVHVRVGKAGNANYLDLGNEKWEVVEITADGWRVMPCPPHVKFRRPNGMLPLPRPENGGTINDLRRFVNVDEQSWHLLVASLVSAYSPTGPYAISLLKSNHGSCKSTTMRVCRQLIDPNVADIRSAPHDVQVLMLSATNGQCICIDNCDKFQSWLSSALCRISTGGGMSARTLYTNDEEHILNCMRPVWITGITDLTDREDFLSRCIIIQCPPMPDDQRRDEQGFYAEFHTMRPRILGALLNGVSAAIRNLPTTEIKHLPRMADFYKFCVAAEPGLGWEQGTFASHFAASQEEVRAIALDDPLVEAVGKLLTKSTLNTFVAANGSILTWSGAGQELLNVLNMSQFSTDSMKASEVWPRNAAALGNRLNRLKVNLGEIGIDVSHHRRTWKLSRTTVIKVPLTSDTTVAEPCLSTAV